MPQRLENSSCDSSRCSPPSVITVHFHVLKTRMNENILAAAARLSDDALLDRLKVLAVRERDATVELVAHLAELHGRRTHLGEGPGSLYEYCRRELGLSEDAAYNRDAAARAVRRYPVILDRLANGSITLTTVRLLGPVLTPENHLALLAEAKHRSRREVELIVRRLDPQPDVPSSIRKLPVPAPVAGPPLPSVTQQNLVPVSPAPTVLQPPPVQRPFIAPLTPERYRVQFTVSKETHDKLRRAQDLLRREIRDGDPGAIFDRALTLLLRDVEKKKMAATSRPRRPRETKDGSRAIPAHVRRAVWRRDDGRCAFVGTRGRCTERAFLELHHVTPFGHQGPATVENISLRCRAHNVYEAEAVFGRYDPSAVRERADKYSVSGEITPVPERRSEATYTIRRRRTKTMTAHPTIDKAMPAKAGVTIPKPRPRVARWTATMAAMPAATAASASGCPTRRT